MAPVFGCLIHLTNRTGPPHGPRLREDRFFTVILSSIPVDFRRLLRHVGVVLQKQPVSFGGDLIAGKSVNGVALARLELASRSLADRGFFQLSYRAKDHALECHAFRGFSLGLHLLRSTLCGKHFRRFGWDSCCLRRGFLLRKIVSIFRT